MEIKKTLFQVLLYITVAFLQSCGQTKKPNLEMYELYRTQHLEYRDSLFVFYTIQRWNDSNFDVFENLSKMYKTTNNSIMYFNDGSFYSPDKLKLIVWEGERIPNSATIIKYSPDSLSNRMCPSSGDTVYNIRVLIGFRPDTNSIWNLFPLNNELVGCFESRKVSINIMGQYYFNKMKDHTMWRLMQSGQYKGEEVSTPYGYNLQDKGFWNKCWLWEKDTITADGLYPFQKKGYNYIGYGSNGKLRAIPVEPPKISYPRYILNMYGDSK
ncbi:MAG: hypothetical protein ABI378_12520 [Chitinophagaceae bacterium]